MSYVVLQFVTLAHLVVGCGSRCNDDTEFEHYMFCNKSTEAINHNAFLQSEVIHHNGVAVTKATTECWSNFSKESTFSTIITTFRSNKVAQNAPKKWQHKYQNSIVFYSVLRWFIFYSRYIQVYPIKRNLQSEWTSRKDRYMIRISARPSVEGNGKFFW